MLNNTLNKYGVKQNDDNRIYSIISAYDGKCLNFSCES